MDYEIVGDELEVQYDLNPDFVDIVCESPEKADEIRLLIKEIELEDLKWDIISDARKE